ncbi:heme exporter protein CcmB [Paraperlucidibaca wandonensis]|jgi:heme exporter protein B|uniref:Heme exporter protein B n=1 Tax=Paraperlucidibaca wandonensis TaxID=1268273 RepID=A0ABW3HDI2_9GAMM|nr:heme exporter protein CcmB [Paraperlucidibaca sp.]MBQ0723223.1 heme exporter protein CcmB [Paraperlucidibaca sp.]MBQ0841784.1 heme exporter protein CcmB [Paraperlucidibaca sp.]|tara:strand:- start:3892 stop:4563 length:672 start_codon:yes stop_codon:yes gene_type:complete
MSAFTAVLVRDLRIGLRQGGGWLNPLVFFLMVIALIPLAVSPAPDKLRELAGGIIWIAALLAVLLAMDGLFRSDFDDGTLEQLSLHSAPLAWLVLAKIIAHWLLTGLCLTLLAPLAALLLNLPAHAIGVLCLSLLMGTLTLSLISAIGAALTVSLRRGGLLVPLITLPLHIPVLIFATAAVQASVAGQPVSGFMALLAAFLLLALMIAPIASAAAIGLTQSID